MRIKKTFQGSLPENTVVNTQSNSQTNTYSCEYVNEHFGRKVLYESAGTNGNISLNDNISNYSFIEIYAHKSGCQGFVKIVAQENLVFGLSIHNVYDTRSIQQMFGNYTLNAQSITKNRELYMNDNGGPVPSNDIYIYKVVGYK